MSPEQSPVQPEAAGGPAPITSEPPIGWQTVSWPLRAPPPPPHPRPHQTPAPSCPQLFQKWISGVSFLVLRILFK